MDDLIVVGIAMCTVVLIVSYFLEQFKSKKPSENDYVLAISPITKNSKPIFFIKKCDDGDYQHLNRPLKLKHVTTYFDFAAILIDTNSITPGSLIVEDKVFKVEAISKSDLIARGCIDKNGIIKTDAD